MNWRWLSPAYFNTLREAFTKTKAKTALESLFDKKKSLSQTRYETKSSESQTLFELPESSRRESSARAMKDDSTD